MFKRQFLLCLIVLGVFGSGYWVGKSRSESMEGSVQAASSRVFEIRTYTANDGKLEALHARFRNHTTKLFKKHGMTNVGYWSPQDTPLSQNTLIYILAHPSRDAAKKNWEAFRNDSEWKKVQQASEANGKLVSKVDSIFMNATDYSPLK